MRYHRASLLQDTLGRLWIVACKFVCIDPYRFCHIRRHHGKAPFAKEDLL